MMSMTSCGTLFYPKKYYGLVDAPADLKITNVKTGKDVPIKKYQMVRIHTSFNSNNETIIYGLGAHMKAKKNTVLALTSGGVTKTVKVSAKAGFPGIAMLYGDFMFCGVPMIVDLLTGDYRFPRPLYIDVPAVLADKPQRTDKELKDYIISHSK